MLSRHKPLLLYGAASSLKTTAVQHLFDYFSHDDSEDETKEFLPEIFNYPLFKTCPPKLLQIFIEKSCEKKNKTLLGSKPGKTNVFFIDDLGLGLKEANAQGLPLELLRQFLEFHGFHDRTKFFWKSVESTAIIACLSEQPGNDELKTHRLLANFQLIRFNPPGLPLLKRLFEGYLSELLLSGGFSEDIKNLMGNVVSASLELFRRLRDRFKPVPRKFSYEFSVKEMILAFRGLSFAKSNVFVMNSREGFVKLWLHENLRVFGDRLVNDGDSQWLWDNLKALSGQFLGFTGDFTLKRFSFSDVKGLDDPNPQPQFIYEEVKDFMRIQRILEDLLMEHARSEAFILSPEIIGYLLRITRLLKLPTPNKGVLSLGLTGSGKKSISRLAALVRHLPVHELNTTSRDAFQDDFRSFLLKALVTKQPYMLLVDESAFQCEEALAKLSILMNPLTPVAELHEAFEDILTEALKTIKNKEQAISLDFKSRCHVMLSGSSETPGLVQGMRDFGLMRHCCGVVQFSAWGNEALLNVAKGLLLENQELAPLVVEIYQIVENEVTMQNGQQKTGTLYLSPKNYVEMIGVFRETHERQRKMLTAKIKTLDNGLNKLAASQTLVSSLNRSLLALEPQLIEQSLKTEEIYRKLALDRGQANEKETIIAQESEAMNLEMTTLQALVADAQRDLEMAYPLLKEAQTALNALNKNDIAEIRTFNNPPPIVAMVLEAVCVLLEEKTDWNSIKVVVTDIEFLSRLTALDKDKIKEGTIRKLRAVIHKPEFNPETIGQKSLACKSLALWCKAIENYYRVERMVRPRRVKAQEMNRQLTEKKKTLSEKAKELVMIIIYI